MYLATAMLNVFMKLNRFRFHHVAVSAAQRGRHGVKPSHGAHTLSRGLMLGAKRPQHKVTPFMLHGSIFVSWISSSVAPTLSISRYRYHFNRLHAFINHS